MMQRNMAMKHKIICFLEFLKYKTRKKVINPINITILKYDNIEVYPKIIKSRIFLKFTGLNNRTI